MTDFADFPRPGENYPYTIYKFGHFWPHFKNTEKLRMNPFGDFFDKIFSIFKKK